MYLLFKMTENIGHCHSSLSVSVPDPNSDPSTWRDDLISHIAVWMGQSNLSSYHYILTKLILNQNKALHVYMLRKLRFRSSKMFYCTHLILHCFWPLPWLQQPSDLLVSFHSKSIEKSSSMHYHYLYNLVASISS